MKNKISLIVAFFLFSFSGTSLHAQTAYVGEIFSNYVKVINAATHTITDSIYIGHMVEWTAVSPDGGKVYFVGADTVTVVNTASKSIITKIPVGYAASGIVVSPDGSKVYVSNTLDYSVSVINTTTNSVDATIPLGGGSPFDLAVTPDGSKVYVAHTNMNNTVTVLNAYNNSVITTLTVGYMPEFLCISPDGSKVYVPSVDDKIITIINTGTNTVTDSFTVSGNPSAIEISNDGTKLYIAFTNNAFVKVYNTTSKTIIDSVAVNPNPHGLSLTPDGSKLYVASLLHMDVINATSNTLISSIPMPNGPSAFGDFISTYSNVTGQLMSPAQQNAISIYPNPFSHQAIVTFEEELNNSIIQIKDVQGKTVKTIPVAQGRQVTISKDELSSGVYFLQVIKSQNIFTKRVIIE
ncbi:MAG TPA: T9SS type A sorting domain-containing protein [Chitinophagales bacterium]|nr:T9SS type A sorting domain-containing protein [Chitinophagales bacterium]